MTNTYLPTKGSATNNQLSILAKRALPSLSGDSVRYNADKNTFYTAGYTSAAGNMYYRTFRLSDRICISCSLGQGYYYTFLNGMVVYAWDGKSPKLIGSWTSPGVTFFSESKVNEVAAKLVKDFLQTQAKINGVSIPNGQLLNYAQMLIAETEKQQNLID